MKLAQNSGGQTSAFIMAAAKKSSLCATLGYAAYIARLIDVLFFWAAFFSFYEGIHDLCQPVGTLDEILAACEIFDGWLFSALPALALRAFVESKPRQQAVCLSTFRFHFFLHNFTHFTNFISTQCFILISKIVNEFPISRRSC